MSKLNKQYLKRKSIFENYSKNLARLVEASGYVIGVDIDGKKQIANFPIYICPLCLSPFTLKSIEGSNPALTLEHVPPKSLGGSAAILTCRNCNNTSGHSTDIAVYRQLDAEPFLRANPNSSTPIRYSINGMPIKGELRFNEQKEPVFFIDKKSNPHHFPDILSYLKQESGTLKFTLSTPSIAHFHKGLLRIAYLQSFTLFGYSFVFNESGARVREMLKKEFEGNKIRVIDVPFDGGHIGLNLIRQPEELSACLFVIPFRIRNRQRNIGVVIPRAGEAGWGNYLNYKLGQHSLVLSHLANYQGVKENPFVISDFYDIWNYSFSEI